MKQLFLTLCVFVCLCLGSCSSHKQLTFVDSDWSFSHSTGNIVNPDSTIQFTIGDGAIDPTMTFISSSDSLQLYPGAQKYLNEILKTCGLSDSKIVFYAPLEHTLWVELPQNYIDIKPRAISSNLTNSLPVTAWVWDDDAHEGNRKPNEIYSNSFVNRKLGALLVVDKMNYGDKPVACIHIYQTDNKMSRKLGFRPWYWTQKGNLIDNSCIDMLSNWIDGRRKVVFENYRLGQQIEHRKDVNRIREELMEIIKLDQEPRSRLMAAWQNNPTDTLLHRSIGREIWRNDSINQIRVLEILENYDLEFGEENEVVWAVIQHSNLELQQKYLPKFIEAAKNRRLKGEFVAVMQDRIAIWSGKPQIYGSQGGCNEAGIFVPSEIEDPENVNVRRASIGMVSLEEYISIMSRK